MTKHNMLLPIHLLAFFKKEKNKLKKINQVILMSADSFSTLFGDAMKCGTIGMVAIEIFSS